MNGKSIGMLILAVLCGLGAMYGTSKMISKDKGGQAAEMQDVVVALKDFKIEEVVKPDTVKIVQMPKTGVPAGAFSSVKDVEDRWVQVAVLENEPLIDRKLAPKGSPPGLIARIPKGMRAFTVEVNEQTGVSGFVLPDHRVDVVQISPSTGGGPPEGETVLQDVLVLASGQVFTRPDDRSLQSRSVTLAVTPEQVDTLVSARSQGALTLSLRGLNDHAQVVSKKKELVRKKQEEEKAAAAEIPPKQEALVAVKPPEPEPPPPPPPVVQVPVPAPIPVPAPPPPARFITVYRGLDNARKIRLDQPPDVTPEDLAAANSGPRPNGMNTNTNTNGSTLPN